MTCGSSEPLVTADRAQVTSSVREREPGCLDDL
jgi:hypothetical protein